MSNKVSIPSRSTVTLDIVDGDLVIGRNALVKGMGTPPKLKVSSTVYCEGDNVLECDLSAENLEADGNLAIRGDLTVENKVEIEDGCLEIYGNMSAKHIDIDKALFVNKDLVSEEIDIGGSLRVDGAVKAECIDVGGSFKARGEVNTSKIDVGGSLSIESKVDIKTLDVGGTAKVNGGRIGEIDVGGSFESNGQLDFESIDVGGTVQLGEKSKGYKIDVGGSFRVEGDLNFESIDVGGKVEINGSGEGKEIDVGGKLEVGGSLKLSGTLDVGGRVEVSGEISAENIEVGGVLCARKVLAVDTVEVGGSINTVEGTIAHFVGIGKRGEVRGPIRADQVSIGKEARVEDIFGKRILLRSGVQAENVYGESITVESNCYINGVVQYTNELRKGDNVLLAKPPQKVDKVPY